MFALANIVRQASALTPTGRHMSGDPSVITTVGRYFDQCLSLADPRLVPLRDLFRGATVQSREVVRDSVQPVDASSEHCMEMAKMAVLDRHNHVVEPVSYTSTKLFPNLDYTHSFKQWVERAHRHHPHLAEKQYTAVVAPSETCMRQFCNDRRLYLGWGIRHMVPALIFSADEEYSQNNLRASISTIKERYTQLLHLYTSEFSNEVLRAHVYLSGYNGVRIPQDNFRHVYDIISHLETKFPGMHFELDLGDTKGQITLRTMTGFLNQLHQSGLRSVQNRVWLHLHNNGSLTDRGNQIRTSAVLT